MKRTRLIVTGLFLASLALSPAWAQGARNTSMVRQEGAGNAAGIQQTGTANEAGVLQFGRGNTGIITQEGTGNSACLVQAGRNLGGSIQQVGDYQTTGMFQTRDRCSRNSGGGLRQGDDPGTCLGLRGGAAVDPPPAGYPPRCTLPAPARPGCPVPSACAGG